MMEILSVVRDAVEDGMEYFRTACMKDSGVPW